MPIITLHRRKLSQLLLQLGPRTSRSRRKPFQDWAQKNQIVIFPIFKSLTISMAAKAIRTVQVAHNGNTVNYLSSPKHRGKPTNDISVWLIDVPAEVACFTTCYQNDWHNGHSGCGFVVAGVQQLLTLGHNLRNPQLVIAKFVTDQNVWHGYPADVRHKPADKPLPPILLRWFQGGFISKSLMTRIKQGQL